MSRRPPARDPRPDAGEPPFARPVPVRALSRRKPLPFDLAPEPGEKPAIARFLGLEALRVLRFRGELVPVGAESWRVEGRLTAEIVHACVVTLTPVVQSIDQAVTRDYVPAEALRLPDEIDPDPNAGDDPDPFDTAIDPGLLAIESLALEIDTYPRAPGVPPARFQATPPGAEPLADEALRPFAGLAALKDKPAGGET